MKQDSLANQLSREIVEALVKIGLTQEDVLGGAIQHTELPWQVPPLVVEATLFGVPLSEYLDSSTYVNSDRLYTLWSDALGDFKNNPDKVLTFNGYKATSYALPALRSNERLLRLSLPEGYPGGITDLAAVVLSLECAHLLRQNALTVEFLNDDDNYCALLPSGAKVGIVDGYPAVWAEIWDGMPINGMVQEILRTPRGSVWEGCDYNILSKVRSLVHEYQRSIRDYEAVDWALQTLRVIDGTDALLAACKNLKQTAHIRKVRLAVLDTALEVARRASITDRQRVETLKGILVPEVLTTQQFSRQVYPYYRQVPPLLAPRAVQRMRENLKALRDSEEALYGVDRK